MKRRRVVRAGIAYVLVAWVVLQAAEITFEPLGMPPWALTWTVLGAVLGLPIALALSWFFDVSRGGVKRERGARGPAGAAFAVAIVMLAVGGIAWWLYGVYAPAKLQADVADSATPSATVVPANSIGVLPFDDLSPDADQGFLADGIAEELLDRLARNSGLKVASRTSSFALRGLAKDMRMLGRQLGVRWLLEGSLRKDSGRVRITAQLIDASNGFHVWSDTYERSDHDLFALQDDIALAISGELSSRIEGVVAVAPAIANTANPEALQAYLRGREDWRKRTAASLSGAEAMFLKAVALDPEFARAWSGLADTYLLQADYGHRTEEEAIRLAEPAAVNAVVLGPKLGEAWASLGLLRSNAGQYRAARSSLEQAMELDPRYEMAAMWLASVYSRMGDLKRQREVLLKAAELNPLEPVINFNLAELMANSGDPNGARAQLERVLAITPHDATLLRGLAMIELGERHFTQAVRAASAALATDPQGPANIQMMMKVLMWIEDYDAAEALAKRLSENSRDRVEALQWIAFRRGITGLQPQMAELVQTIATHSYSAADVETLTLAGMIELSDGKLAEAVEWLSLAAGTPEQLEDNQDRLNPASLLVVALRQLGHDAQARQWEEPLLAASTRAMPPLGDHPRRYLVEALVATHLGDERAAVAALQTAYQKGFRERWQLLRDPRLRPLLSHPEIQNVQQRMDDELSAARAAAASVPAR